MIEIWEDIKEYEGIYQVSNFGKIKSVKRNLIKKNCVDGYGYYSIGLWKNGKRKTFKVHRLVAEAFIPNKANKPTVNHLNGNKQDNRVCNLEWATNKEQQIHSQKILGHKSVISEECRKKQIESKKRKIIRNDGKIYNSIREAEKDVGISYSNIWRCCKKYRKNAGGYSWEYL